MRLSDRLRGQGQPQGKEKRAGAGAGMGKGPMMPDKTHMMPGMDGKPMPMRDKDMPGMGKGKRLSGMLRGRV